MTDLEKSAYDAKQRKAFEKWRATTLFYSYAERNKAVNEPMVFLPANSGYVFSVLVENEDQLKDFIIKFDNLDQWVEGGVIKLISLDDDEDCYVETLTVTDPKTKESSSETISCYPIPKKVEGYVFDYNPLFPRKERVQCSKKPIGAFKREHIEVLVAPDYPCMVKYWCERESRNCGVLSISFSPIRPPGVIEVQCS